jgi:hypothetical protein
VWARALAAVSLAATLLTVVDAALGVTDSAYGLGGEDVVGGVAASLGVMGCLALASLLPLGLAVRFLARRWPVTRAAALVSGVLLAALVWIDWTLLAARPLLVGPGLLAFAGSVFVLVRALAHARWRRAAVVGAAGGALALAVLNGRTFVGVNPDQHLALVVGAWTLAVSAGWVVTARVERDESVRGWKGGALVSLGIAALVLLAVRGSGVADESLAARYFVRRLAPQSAAVLRGLEPMLDVDGDGFGGGFGGGDCAPLDGQVHPDADERAGDGVDQNCLAGDPTAGEIEALEGVLIGKGGAATRPAKQLLLVTIDAMRSDHALPATRERLGDRCVEMSVAYAVAPTTTYSVHALMTGRYPSQAEYTRLGRFNVPVDDPAPRVANVLRDAGFSTGAAVFHHRFDPRLGLVDGFDEVWTAQPRPEIIRGDAASATIEHARDWISAAAGAPTFSWVHLYDPHEPYLPREGDGSARERYAAEVRYTDARLAELLDAWPGLDETAIVLTGDHGEAFGEHGERLHGSSLFEEQVRVPLWVCPPRGQPIPPDVGPVSGLDVAPTLLALAGVARPDGMSGRSLLSGPAGPVFAETAGESTPMTMVVAWPYKLLHLPQGGLWMLFDLEQDPGERVNLAEREPERLAELQALLDRWLAWRGPESPTFRSP